LTSSPVVTNFNYPTNNLDKENNISFWNFVVGKTGKDVTEILKNPDSSNSLTSLAQRVEKTANKNYEILTFEKAYINDDVQAGDGTSRTAVLTPGLTYYIDGALTSENFFNPTSAESLKDSVSTSLSSLKDIFSSYDEGNSEFLFNSFISARTKENLFSTNVPAQEDIFLTDEQQSGFENNDLSYKNINKIIRNPLHLIRFLENQLLTENFLPRSKVPADVKDTKDISPLLVSFALTNLDKSYGNNHLLSLIYMYVLVKTNALLASTNVNRLNDVTNEIKKYFVDYFANNGSNPYCQLVVRPKVEKFKKSFEHLIKK
jgi:hypothetical protein